MIVLVRTWEFVQRVGIVLAGAAIGGASGFYGPLLFDRDVGGAMWAGILGIAGSVIGAMIGLIVARHKFD
jgi:hypothetical protein